ncbi:putative damage-inducible protein DinB [Chitinophaga niastensis]|uniref:Putative damage-inducible protein DinB n=1 Tax=Chitinophaga niastensis TaxID=536980 RepID=A0A2P8HGG8_CHINA|nr:DinB family protein [Chitinophaga niastensis]PSL45305.1 putative damage-inducible protein DinB [Chitinophaga niastensis]
MEITSVTTFLEYYDKIRTRTNKLIQVVPPDLLEWTYRPGKFTIGDHIRHISTIERYMYAETIAGRLSAYQGCGKDLADGYENVINFFNELHRQSLEIFSSLTDEDLKKKCTTPGNATMSTWKWMRAMVEHEIHHRGQIYVYLGMLGVSTPPIFGLTSEEVVSRSVMLPAI